MAGVEHMELNHEAGAVALVGKRAARVASNPCSKLTTGAQSGKDFGVGEAWLAWFAAMALVIAVSSWTHRHIERSAETYLRGLRRNRRPAEEPETALAAAQQVGTSGA